MGNGYLCTVNGFKGGKRVLDLTVLFHKGIINVHFVGGVTPHNGQVGLFHLAVHKLLMHGFFYILVESKEQYSACFPVKPMYGTDMLAYLRFQELKRKLLGIPGNGRTMNQ